MTLIIAHMCNQQITQLSPQNMAVLSHITPAWGCLKTIQHLACLTSVLSNACPMGFVSPQGRERPGHRQLGQLSQRQPTPAQRAATAGADVKASKGNPDKLPVSQLWEDATHSLQTGQQIPLDTAQPLLELQGSPQAFQCK